MVASTGIFLVVQNEQKRFLESWESRIYFPYVGNKLRKKYLGAPLSDNEEKMKLAKKLKKSTDSKLRLQKPLKVKPGVSLKKHFEEIAKLNPKGTKKGPNMNGLDFFFLHFVQIIYSFE